MSSIDPMANNRVQLEPYLNANEDLLVRCDTGSHKGEGLCPQDLVNITTSFGNKHKKPSKCRLVQAQYGCECSMLLICKEAN